MKRLSLSFFLGLAACFSPDAMDEELAETSTGDQPMDETEQPSPATSTAPGGSTTTGATTGAVVEPEGSTSGVGTTTAADGGSDETGEGSTGGTGTTGPVDSTRRVFLSSERFFSVDLQDADLECQQLADAAALGGSWVAWISGSTIDAVDKLTPGAGPYVLLDEAGTVIAEDNDDLVDGDLEAPIAITELGDPFEGGAATWTGTTADGTLAEHNCEDWSTVQSAGQSEMGNVTQSGGCWTECTGNLTCSNQSRIYCFEV